MKYIVALLVVATIGNILLSLQNSSQERNLLGKLYFHSLLNEHYDCIHKCSEWRLNSCVYRSKDPLTDEQECTNKCAADQSYSDGAMVFYQ